MQVFTLDELKRLEKIQDYKVSEVVRLSREIREQLIEEYWIPVKGKTFGIVQTCNLCPRIIWAHAYGETTYYRHGSDTESILKIVTPDHLIMNSQVVELMHWMNGLHAKELISS